MPLTQLQSRVLSALSWGGGQLESRRTYPFPHTYHLVTRDEAGKQHDESIGEASVRRLVERGWVAPRPQDAAWDHVIYHLTAAGRAVIDEQEKAS